MNPNCTTLDHIYKFPARKGDPCYCGAKRWGIEQKIVKPEKVIEIEIKTQDDASTA